MWDKLAEWTGTLMAILLILGLIAGFVVVIKWDIDSEKESMRGIAAMGYQNPEEIKIFCKSIGVELDAFIVSPGIRKQYEKFQSGETTDFTKQAQAKKQSDDKSSGARAGGMVTGYVVGNMMRR